MSRTPVLVTLVAVAALALTGCGGGDTSVPDGPGQSGMVAPTLDADDASSDLGPLPETSGTVSMAGDLCRIVDADVARQALGYTGELEVVVAEPGTIEGEGNTDGCRYTGTVDGKVANALVVIRSGDDATWARTVRMAELTRGGTVDPPEGADAATFSPRANEAGVRIGEVQALVLNQTPGQYDRAGLFRLGTVAAKAAA